MSALAFHLTDALSIEQISPERALEVHRTDAAPIWIDVDLSDGDALEAWLDKLAVKDLTRKICLDSRDRAGFYPLKNELLLVVPMVRSDLTEGDVDYVAFLCRESLFLSLHGHAFLTPERLAELHESKTWLPGRNVAGLMSAIMLSLSLDSLGHTTRLRDAITVLEKRMDQNPDEVEADELLNLRAELLTVEGVVNDQLPCADALRGTDRPFFKLVDAKEYLHCALTNLQAAARSLEWMGRRFSALRAGFDMHSQERTNRRLGMLTILSAIFMPITLLAGIWGMNFEQMPELKSPWGYAAALALMVLIGTGMFVYFRRKGWFD